MDHTIGTMDDQAIAFKLLINEYVKDMEEFQKQHKKYGEKIKQKRPSNCYTWGQLNQNHGPEEGSLS